MNNLKTPVKSLRVLIVAPDSNPLSTSTSLAGYSHSEALAQLHEVTLVIRQANLDSHRQKPSQVLYSVLGRGPKPALGPPKVLPPRNQRIPVSVPESRAVED